MVQSRLAMLGTVAAGVIGAAIAVTSAVTHAGARERIAPLPVASTQPPADPVSTEDLAIKQGDTLDEVLGRAGFDAAARYEMATELGRAFDVRKMRAGSHLTVARTRSGVFQSLEYAIDPDHKVALHASKGALAAAIEDIPGTIRTVPICTTMHGSLFESIGAAGERAELALTMAEIFAWDIDFYRDPQDGDRFCLVVEKKEYANGAPPTYRRVLAANYNSGGTLYDAFLFADAGGAGHYYSHDGRSLQSAFLRSPLKFDARISSHFSRSRLHPILHYYRAHLGTDFAVPTGTPVRAVAAGRVEFSGRSGGSGNLITLQHAGGYETQYLHLSKRLVQAGQKVAQGQDIGLVGSTGLATGPHLDFRVRRNGQYLNFEKLRLPREATIGARERAAFTAIRDRYAALMDTGTAASAVAVGANPPKVAAP